MTTTSNPFTVSVHLPTTGTNMYHRYDVIAGEVVDVLRGKISGQLHDAILRELLLQECNGSSLTAGRTVKELIERLS